MKKNNEDILIEDIASEWISVYAGKISYEKKLDEYAVKVYGCNYSQRRRYTKKLSKIIDRTVERNKRWSKKQSKNHKLKIKLDKNKDIDNIILIAVNCLELPPYMADRVKLIMARMWDSGNFKGIRYENAVLGILMYVVYEDLSEAITVDFNDYCIQLLGAKKAERNTRQMYRAYVIVCDIYKEVESEMSKLTQQIWQQKKSIYTTC